MADTPENDPRSPTPVSPLHSPLFEPITIQPNPDTEVLDPIAEPVAGPSTINTNIPPTVSTSRSPSPAGSSSSPRKRKRMPGSFSDLINKAKATKNSDNQDVKQAITEDTDLADDLETELRCSICCDIFRDPVNLLDCLHTYCGACALNWFKTTHNSCPTCRKSVRQMRDSYGTSTMLALLFKRKPELAPTKEALEEARKTYKPGKQISIPIIDYYDSDSEDDVQMTQEWNPCPCCATGENAHPLYTCPDPILDSEHSRNDVSAYKGHRFCSQCAKEVPSDRNEPVLRQTFCACCSITYCGNIFNGCRADPDGNYLLKLGDTSLYGPELDRNFPRYFNGNTTEQDSCKRWMESSGITWDDLGRQLGAWLFRKYDGVIPWTNVTETLTPESYMCKCCLPRIFDYYFTDFMIAERGRLGWTDDRTPCWYGKNCRTQHHNNSHCERLGHVCLEVPVGERREMRQDSRSRRRAGLPARRDVVTATGGVRGLSFRSPSPGTRASAENVVPDDESGGVGPVPQHHDYEDFDEETTVDEFPPSHIPMPVASQPLSQSCVGGVYQPPPSPRTVALEQLAAYNVGSPAGPSEHGTITTVADDDPLHPNQY